MKFQTMRTQDLIEVSLESRECLDMLFDLMKNTELEDYDTYSFYTMCELVWLNSQILFLLRRDLDEISFKDDTQEEVLMSEQTLQALILLMTANHQAKLDLNFMSFSLRLH